MGCAVVALGLLVPIGPVSALAVRTGRLLPGSIWFGLVSCRHYRARSGDAVVHYATTLPGNANARAKRDTHARSTRSALGSHNSFGSTVDMCRIV